MAAAVSTAHGLLTFPTPKGAVQMWVDRMCIATIAELPFTPPADRAEPEKSVIKPKYPEQTVTVGTTIPCHTPTDDEIYSGRTIVNDYSNHHDTNC
jgi:hypothetical protein